MISTTRKRVLVASIAGIALIGSGIGTAALASAGDSPSTSTSAATTSGGDTVATVGHDGTTTTGGTDSRTSTEPKISGQQAIEIAKDEVSGTVTEVELDEDDGRLHWEVEIDGKENREHDLDIAANDGTILSHDIDNDRDDDRDDDDGDGDDDGDDD